MTHNESISLDMVPFPARGSRSGGAGSSGSFHHPHPLPNDPSPTSHTGGSASPTPEHPLKIFAFRLAVLEKSASGLGKLAFVWATVVLLGGFAITLEREDFVFVTFILVTESTRLFSRSHELEWQHQAPWTLTGAGRSSLRAFRSSSRFFLRVLYAALHPLSALHSEAGSGRRLPDSGNAHASDTAPHSVPLLPPVGWAFVSKYVSAVLWGLQITSAWTCIALSLTRLIRHDYGEVAKESRNRNLALNLFYCLALAEAFIFLMEKVYWWSRISYSNLLLTVSNDYGLGFPGLVLVRRFFYDTYSKCISGSAFDGLKMDLVTFAKELLDSEFRDEQLIGAQVLQKLTSSEQFAADTLSKIGASTWVMERFVEMLDWRNSAEEEIRRCAAQVVAKLVEQHQNVLRLAAIPGAVGSISSLLHTGRGSNSNLHELNAKSLVDDTNYDFTVFNLLGLLILKSLATDHDNCWKIGNARGLLAKIIDFTGASRTLLQDDHASVSQITMVERSLQVVKMLASASGSTGKMLRRKILEMVLAVNNIREIVQFGDKHSDLQRAGIEILKNLAMEEEGREKIGRTGGVLRLLLSIFLMAAGRAKLVRDEAGETLAMLTLESESNCRRISKDPDAVEQLVGALDDPDLRVNASRILRNLCAYLCTQSPAHGRHITTAMPIVLKAVMTAQDKLLEVSIALTTQICKRMGPDEFAEALKQASVEEADIAKQLAGVLSRYTYPHIKVPRMRRYVIEQAIWMMESNRNSVQLFRQLGMERLLESVAETTSELECFHIFSGSVGLSPHRETISSLVEKALGLMAPHRQSFLGDSML